ncbi:MAG: ribonuclease P protein component [Mycobacterium sp.]
MLPARHRMTRSADFGTTVKRGVRAAQPDLVVHAHRGEGNPRGPAIGFVVSKSVGGSVQRHRVSRRLRHLVGSMISNLEPTDRIVIRALPGSRTATSARLRQELGAALDRAQQLMERRR